MIPELGVVAYQQPQEAVSLITLLVHQDHRGVSPSHYGWRGAHVAPRWKELLVPPGLVTQEGQRVTLNSASDT